MIKKSMLVGVGTLFAGALVFAAISKNSFPPCCDIIAFAEYASNNANSWDEYHKMVVRYSTGLVRSQDVGILSTFNDADLQATLNCVYNDILKNAKIECTSVKEYTSHYMGNSQAYRNAVLLQKPCAVETSKVAAFGLAYTLACIKKLGLSK